MENREYTLMPKSSLPDLLGVGFYIPRTIEILDTYGGWTRQPLSEGDPVPGNVHADFLSNYPQSSVISAQRLCSNPSAALEIRLEVLYFVIITTDGLFQSSMNRSTYLDFRDQTQLTLYSVLFDLFGLDSSRQDEIDAAIVERSQHYGSNQTKAMLLLARIMDGTTPSNPLAFAKAAMAYVYIAFGETFGRMILYESAGLSSWAAVCPNCGGTIRTKVFDTPTTLSCGSCNSEFPVTQVYS